MPSTISAGTTAGTAIAIAGDTTGNLAFQTNGTTTAMTVDTSQNVGIGTTSPVTKLHVEQSTTGEAFRVARGGNYLIMGGSGSGTQYVKGFEGIVAFGNAFAGPTIFLTGDTERGRFTAGGDFQFNSGYGSVATAYGCRAWVNFNGQGTVAIRASGNVSSITDLGGAGQYRINFTSNLPDANYAVACMCTDDNVANRGINLLGTNSDMTTSSFRVNIFANGDPSAFCAMVMR